MPFSIGTFSMASWLRADRAGTWQSLTRMRLRVLIYEFDVTWPIGEKLCEKSKKLCHNFYFQFSQSLK